MEPEDHLGRAKLEMLPLEGFRLGVRETALTGDLLDVVERVLVPTRATIRLSLEDGLAGKVFTSGQPGILSGKVPEDAYPLYPLANVTAAHLGVKHN